MRFLICFKSSTWTLSPTQCIRKFKKISIPIILIGYFQWGTSAEFWSVIIGHVIIQVVDGNVIVPILFSDAVNIHPLAILIAILFFGSIWGIWGVFFAIPLAVFLNTLINIWPTTKVEV